ncbi:hypothetical protein F4778DRAFT_748388 [Xylariomycetidae sp. FL2044]|nr:hypothetical protein F4778DRAFT_748388 [Xylariomycetidae sp. FL2044]
MILHRRGSLSLHGLTVLHVPPAASIDASQKGGRARGLEYLRALKNTIHLLSRYFFDSPVASRLYTHSILSH